MNQKFISHKKTCVRCGKNYISIIDYSAYNYDEPLQLFVTCPYCGQELPVIIFDI